MEISTKKQKIEKQKIPELKCKITNENKIKITNLLEGLKGKCEQAE